MSVAKTQVYAVCRYDAYLDGIGAFTVVKIFGRQSRAVEEEVRLNALNAEKGSTYFVRITRLVQD
jgi:hypothetical protein